MKEKLFLFIILGLIAGTLFIFGSETKKIVCSNLNHTCYTVTENSILKSTRKGPIFDVSHKNENVTNDFGDNPDLGHFVCKARRHTIHENSKTSYKIKYYLVPFPQRHGLKFSKPKALNSYSSLASCEIDKQALESYLDSDETEDLVYQTAGSKMSILFYVGAAALLLLGLIIVLFGRTMTPAEAEKYKDLTQEQEDALYEKAMAATDKLKVFDSITGGKISQIENELNKFDNNDNK